MQKAIGFYTEAIKLNGKNATYYSNRAAAYLELGSFVQAEVDCTTTIGLDKKNVKAYLRGGTAREMLSYYKDAIDDFRHALVLEPTNKTANLASNRLKKKGLFQQEDIPVKGKCHMRCLCAISTAASRGTAMRPLTAAVVAAGGKSRYILDGAPRMRGRPIRDLVSGLKQLDADIDCMLGTNCPLVSVNANGGLHGGKVKLSGTLSSQFLTSILMAAPLALGNVEIETIDKLISVPYVEMTIKLMQRFGVSVEYNGA